MINLTITNEMRNAYWLLACFFSMAALVAHIDMTRGENPLASALRLHALAVKRNNI